jgi:hypothetical protein
LRNHSADSGRLQQFLRSRLTFGFREGGGLSEVYYPRLDTPSVRNLDFMITEIDRLILTAWRRKLPVYLELPCDISYLEIEVPEHLFSP